MNQEEVTTKDKFKKKQINLKRVSEVLKKKNFPIFLVCPIEVQDRLWWLCYTVPYAYLWLVVGFASVGELRV